MILLLWWSSLCEYHIGWKPSGCLRRRSIDIWVASWFCDYSDICRIGLLCIRKAECSESEHGVSEAVEDIQLNNLDFRNYNSSRPRLPINRQGQDAS